jgi:transposase
MEYNNRRKWKGKRKNQMKGHIFTPEFKLQVVRQVISGEKTVVQLWREHNLSDSLIHNWKKLYREKGKAAFTTSTARGVTPQTAEAQELRELRNRVADLERFIGKPSVELSSLKKPRRYFLNRPTTLSNARTTPRFTPN